MPRDYSNDGGAGVVSKSIQPSKSWLRINAMKLKVKRFWRKLVFFFQGITTKLKVKRFWRKLVFFFQGIAKGGLHMFHILLLLFALFFAGWLFFKIFVFAASLPFSPAEFLVMPFEGDATQKTQAPAILSAKLRELKRGRTAPTGYGLLTVPLLESAPQQTEQMTSSFGELDKLQVKIKDVDVSAVIRVFDALLTPVHYELRGNVVDLPTSLSVTCHLYRGEERLGSWEASGKKPASNPPSDAKPAPAVSAIPAPSLENLLDQVVYQIVFDLATNEKFKDWKILIPRGIGNWRSLRAYVRGLRALRSYQESLEPGDLQEAIRFFETLTISDSTNPYGLYFLGLAQSEDRREAEAVDTFGQLQRLLGRQTQTPESLRIGREARLNEATARLKLYWLEEAKEAVKILDGLCAELKTELAGSPADQEAAKAEQEKTAADAPNRVTPKKDSRKAKALTAKDNSYTTKLLTVCYAQLGYTHGTILSLKELKMGSASKVQEEREKAMALVKKHEDAMKENLKLAEEMFGSVGGHWASDREKMDVRFRIDNARGYGLYRKAYFEKQQGGDFPKLCNQAIEELEKADQARPNHYEVLQNIAMIYADKDFDDTGLWLQAAQRLFERTKQFVPNDYYQYEQLAKIHMRLMESCPTDGCRTVEIEAGRKEANEAIRLRKRSGTAVDTLLSFAVKEWEMKSTETTATAALSAFKDAMPFLQDRSDFQSRYVEFLGKLAETRKSSAAGLNELIERALALAHVPNLSPEQKKELVAFAKQQIAQSLMLTKDPAKPENKELHARAEKLEQEVNAL
ncbi:MAG: hypothetical protein QOJ45_1591 [Verrucomicrobiota bacterium]|jgi:hypothetical protein